MKNYTFVLLLLVAAPASAQTIGPVIACGIDTKIFGCVDIPAPQATVSRGSHIELQGWALSCYTAQQPSAMQIYYLMDDGAGHSIIHQADPKDYVIVWRGERPDVFAMYSHYCNITTKNWGYAITLDASKLALGNNVIAVQFFDPAVGVGVSTQQVNVNVVP